MTEAKNYEDYWSITFAFTDYDGASFLAVLKTCVDFVDRYKLEPYSEEKYARLQILVVKQSGISLISARKAINQMVKMGFLNSFLVSYHPDAPNYIEAKTHRKRKSLLSKILYSNSSFDRSVNHESDLHQLNFLINTLVENGKLKVSEIIALMLVDIGSEPKKYLTREEISAYETKAEKEGFIKRKYNQISYLTNLLKKLDDVCFVGDELYFTEDARQIFGESLGIQVRKRNPYLHLLYKNQLKEESYAAVGKERCMVERLPYPILIASHIKPFVHSSEEEAYNPHNGLLLSQNLDGLFDKGYISFDDEGRILMSKLLDPEIRDSLVGYRIESDFLKPERVSFLAYHRELFRSKLESCL